MGSERTPWIATSLSPNQNKVQRVNATLFGANSAIAQSASTTAGQH